MKNKIRNILFVFFMVIFCFGILGFITTGFLCIGSTFKMTWLSAFGIYIIICIVGGIGVLIAND